MRLQIYGNSYLLVFLPALNLDVFFVHITESADESTCQAGVGDQWNVVIDRCTTDLLAIGQLALAVVFRNVDNQFEHVLAEHIHDVQVALFVRPANCCRRDAVFI